MAATIGEARPAGKSRNHQTRRDEPAPIRTRSLFTGLERQSATPPRRTIHQVRHMAAWLLGVALASVTLQAPAEDDPQALVSTTTAELFARVQGQREALRAEPASFHPMVEKVLLPHVDLERTSRLVLGKHWRRATAPQRKDFMAEFRALLLRTYSTAIIEFADVNVVYLDTRFSDNRQDAIVRSRVRFTDGRPDVAIDYRLGRDTGAWKVFDVIVGGISLVTTYRTSFGNEVSRGGLDGLVSTLRDRNQRDVGHGA